MNFDSHGKCCMELMNLVADRLHTFSITLEESGLFHLREKASLGDIVNHNKEPETENLDKYQKISLYPHLRDQSPGSTQVSGSKNL